LNASHTLSCGLAYLAGFTTVKEAMNDKTFGDYISRLMFQEIVPLVVRDDISIDEANHFAGQVIDRFKNPFIEHQWLAITVQYTSKMVMRTVPLLEKYYSRTTEAPELMALGFAAFILFMRSTKKDENAYYSESNGTSYRVQDDKAALFCNEWQADRMDTIVENILQDTAIFGKDLTQYNGFADTVHIYLLSLMEQGVSKTLRSGLIKKPVI
jgi:tagaturonate reductase